MTNQRDENYSLFNLTVDYMTLVLSWLMLHYMLAHMFPLKVLVITWGYDAVEAVQSVLLGSLNKKSNLPQVQEEETRQ